MLRFKVLFSVRPLAAAALMARLDLLPGPQPCIAVGADAMQMATSPWRADLRVSFTDDPALATVRVALADSAETADFAVVDDAGEVDGSGACATTHAVRFIAIADSVLDGAPVIYLSPDGPADYRIFVRSTRLTPREAAAMLVGVRGEPLRLAGSTL